MFTLFCNDHKAAFTHAPVLLFFST